MTNQQTTTTDQVPTEAVQECMDRIMEVAISVVDEFDELQGSIIVTSALAFLLGDLVKAMIDHGAVEPKYMDDMIKCVRVSTDPTQH